jgi:hypothetical protein
LTTCALLRTATSAAAGAAATAAGAAATAAGAAASTVVAAVAVIATTGAAGAYAASPSLGPARRTTAHAAAATPAALARAVGPGLAALSLPEARARVTAAIDRHVERVAALATRVGTSERLSIDQRARATERLAAARAELADLRADVCEQTSAEGLARVLTEAHRHRVFWRNWTFERRVGGGTGAASGSATSTRAGSRVTSAAVSRATSDATAGVRSLAGLTAPAAPGAA